MSTRHLGERYEYLSENRVEQYGGDINIYLRWEKHLMFACPSAYRVPTAMRLGDFLEQMLKPDYAAHPDCAALDFTRCQWKLDKAKALGADLCVLDQGQDWSKEVRAWTQKRGVDMAVDSSGKATHLNCIKSLARGGAYVTPGCTSGPDATTDLARVFWNQLRIMGSTMGTNAEFREVVSLYRAGLMKPVVDRVFKAEQAGEAYAKLEGAEQFGKIVIAW